MGSHTSQLVWNSKCFTENACLITLSYESIFSEVWGGTLQIKILEQITRPQNIYLNKLLISQVLKLVSAIFYEFFIFLPSDSPSKTVKNVFLFHLKSSFRSRDIQIFVIFPLPFYIFQIQKNKWKWNNWWCHELACINLQA